MKWFSAHWVQLYTQMLEGMKIHPYATLITTAAVNGRLAAFAAGAFATKGYINPCIAYCIFVMMDFMGDTLYYTLGRVGHLRGKLFMRKSWQRKLRRLHEGWEKNLSRAVFIGKITGISKPVIVMAGMAKMPLAKFWGINVPCILVSFVLYMAAGYFFGQLIIK